MMTDTENHASNNMSKNVALIVATLSSFLTPFMGSSVNIALPSIGGEFQLNAVILSWVATAYLLAAAMFRGKVRGNEKGTVS